MLVGPDGIFNKATRAKIETEQAEARERVNMEVLGSYGKDGKIDLDELNKNLREHLKDVYFKGEILSETNRIEELPATVEYKKVEVTITGQGTVLEGGDSGDSPVSMEIKVCGISNDGETSVTGWAFSIFKDKDCMQVLKENIEVEASNGEYDCSSIIKNPGTYYIGVTETPPGYNTPSELFEVKITSEPNQVIYISFELGVQLGESAPGVYGINSASKDPKDLSSTDLESKASLTVSILDFGGPYTSINAYNDNVDENFYRIQDCSGLGSDLAFQELVADLYKIGEWDSEQDKYVFENNFKDLENFDTSSLNNVVTYDPILTSRLKSIITSKNLEPTCSVAFGERTTDDDNLMKKDCYFVMIRGGDSEEIGKTKTTFYEIDFIPLVVSFPFGGDVDEDIYDFDLTISSVNGKNRFSDVEIINKVEDPGKSFEPQVSIYAIEGTYNDEPVYSDFVKTVYKTTGTNTTTIKLFSGLDYTFTEVYSGSKFSTYDSEQRLASLPGDEVSNVTFEKEYNNIINNSSSVANKIKFINQREGWKVEPQDKDGITSKVNIVNVSVDTSSSDRITLNKKIENTSSETVYVRVKAFFPDLSDDYSEIISYLGDDWTLGEDGYYYNEKVLPNESTGDFSMSVALPNKDSIMQESYNIVVVAETTKVVNDDGPLYEDWTATEE